MVQHRYLTTDTLHPMPGLEYAEADQIYVADGPFGASWVDEYAGVPDAIFRQEWDKTDTDGSNGANGYVDATSSWVEVLDNLGGSVLSSGTFVLPAGSYFIKFGINLGYEGLSPGLQDLRARLYDQTAAAVVDWTSTTSGDSRVKSPTSQGKFYKSRYVEGQAYATFTVASTLVIQVYEDNIFGETKYGGLIGSSMGSPSYDHTGHMVIYKDRGY